MPKNAKTQVAGFFKSLFDFAGSTIKTIVKTIVIGCLVLFALVFAFLYGMAALIR